MSIIITKKGSRATKVDPTPFPHEDPLQEFIFNNPETVPIYDIREDIKLLILAREFSTSSGPIDAIGIDNAGNIYLIETKLFRNADKRLVVAQVLDYGAALWREMRDYQLFVNQIDGALEKQGQPNFSERAQQYFGLNNEARGQLLQQIQRNFQDGSFKFVVLMDTLHEQLKNLIVYLNQNSEFDVYAVELKYYKHESFEIVIPHLFGAETKKDLTQKTRPPLPSDKELIEAYTTVGQQGPVQEFLDLFNDLREDRISIQGVVATKTPKYFTITAEHDSGRTSFQLCIDPSYEGGGIQVWTWTHAAWVKANEAVTAVLPTIKTSTDIGEKPYSKLAKWQLSQFSRKTFELLLKRLGQR
ncbi:MAG: hypothetical protein V1778_05250 [bacterium]